MDQGTTWELRRPKYPLGLTQKARFALFHHLNPWVYGEMARLARQYRARGRKRLSIWLLGNVVRWNYYERTSDPNSVYKLSNGYLAHYARLLMAQETDLMGLFQIKQMKEDS